MSEKSVTIQRKIQKVVKKTWEGFSGKTLKYAEQLQKSKKDKKDKKDLTISQVDRLNTRIKQVRGCIEEIKAEL